MKRKIIPFAAVTAAMVLSMSVAPISSYFTDHHTANGSIPVKVKPTTDIEEKFGDRKKTIVLKNTGNPDDHDPAVFARVHVFSALQPTSISSASGNWDTTPDEQGWYYYKVPIQPGESADALVVELDFPKNATEEDEYNVEVVYETTVAQYEKDGTPKADWNEVLDRVSDTQSNQS
jgi:hypothetical protein